MKDYEVTVETDDPRIEVVAEWLWQRVMRREFGEGEWDWTEWSHLNPVAAKQPYREEARELLALADSVSGGETVHDIDGLNYPAPEAQLEGERCQSCERRYETVWQASEEIWGAVVGGSRGLLCPDCFDRKAREVGRSPYWSCAEADYSHPAEAQLEADGEGK